MHFSQSTGATEGRVGIYMGSSYRQQHNVIDDPQKHAYMRVLYVCQSVCQHWVSIVATFKH